MRAHGNASSGALLGLLIAASGACAEQHHGDSREPDRSSDVPRDDPSDRSDAPPPNPRGAQTTSGTTNSAGMVATPPGTGATSPSAMGQTPPASGATASTTPIPFPDPGPFDPMRTGCGSARASEGVWLAVTSPDHTCNRDEDCFAVVGTVSCSSECARGSLNVAERANVERLLLFVEDKYCTPYRKANCPVLAPTGCSSDESLPRCVEHSCSAVPQRCEAGCKPDRPGGTCRGAEQCDGCPSVIIEADGKPCSKPGQMCTLDSSCSARVRCKDDKEPGVFRWELFIPLC